VVSWSEFETGRFKDPTYRSSKHPSFGAARLSLLGKFRARPNEKNISESKFCDLETKLFVRYLKAYQRSML